MTDEQRISIIHELEDYKHTKLSASMLSDKTIDMSIQSIISVIKYEKVIDDIRAEIKEKEKESWGYPNIEYAKGLCKALEIIDKHIGGKNETSNNRPIH